VGVVPELMVTLEMGLSHPPPFWEVESPQEATASASGSNASERKFFISAGPLHYT
jgi:hypothetical protein